jgi:hypothetical protein
MDYQQRRIGKDPKAAPSVIAVGTTMGGFLGYLKEAEKQRGNKIVSILKLMQELESADKPSSGVIREERDVRNSDSSTYSRAGIPVPNARLRKTALSKYEKDLDPAHKEFLLYRELSRYRFVPRPELRRRGWVMNWQITRRTKQAWSDIEGIALEMILEFAIAKRLNRLRKCSNCSEWIFAKFRHQMYCSTKCQQKHYGQSEESKRYRREYMKRYRDVSI